MKSDTRTSRATESRAAEEQYTDRVDEELYIDDIDFSPANLDTKNIPPREGYDQRWVRTKTGAEDDVNNVYRSTNLGWKPRRADTVPKGALVPTVEFNGDNIIGMHDTILMERPKIISEKHKAYEKQQADNLLRAAEEDMHKVHDRKSGIRRPEYNAKSDVSRGRVAPVSSD